MGQRDVFAQDGERSWFLPPARDMWASRPNARNTSGESGGRWSLVEEMANGLSGSEPDVRAGVAGQNRSTLHRGLGVSDRRLLHMIDAMASFQPRGASDLARSSRHRDQKVAALLTSLPDGR